MNKQKVFAVSLVVLLGALIVGGTSAYFTFSERARNYITTSGIAIELIEDTDQIGVDGRAVPFRNVEGAMPGDKISKIPKVKNVDEGEAYVRMKVVASATLKNGETREIPLSMFELDIRRIWHHRDGYYYYQTPLASGETTLPLFTTVTIPQNVSDEYQGATFALDVTAEAVQTANNGSNVMEAQGWPEE